ncbi:MAG TPA: aminoglycoside phosphotransferase family protein [Steroidobacteraceae bacterium]|nr:aminoglycoside phosphotransferase family protein [Steroidobacteraceae bacterium]
MAAPDPIGVAMALAREAGLKVQQPVSLRSTNNTVVWLKPEPVVAKVGTASYPRLQIELRVAQALCALGGPSVCPARQIAPVVHSRGGFDLTFWRYYAQDPQVDMAAEHVAAALRRLHLALDRLAPSLRATLPSYLTELDVIRSLLADNAALPALAAADRDLLRRAFDSLRSQLLRLAPPQSHVVLHGAPHAHNILVVDNEPIFIDFETTCVGPVEWDVAYLEPGTERCYGQPLQVELLRVCRAMTSVRTAVWCWADVERGDLREHAEWHLAQVKANHA